MSAGHFMSAPFRRGICIRIPSSALYGTFKSNSPVPAQPVPCHCAKLNLFLRRSQEMVTSLQDVRNIGLDRDRTRLLPRNLAASIAMKESGT